MIVQCCEREICEIELARGATAITVGVHAIQNDWNKHFGKLVQTEVTHSGEFNSKCEVMPIDV